MTPAGWVFLAVAWGSVIAVAAYCLTRTLRAADATPPDEPPERSELEP